MESVRPTPRLTRAVLQRLGIVLAIGSAMLGVTLIDIPLCPFAATFHIPCPGCGMTRATLAMAQGHITTAFKLHPVAPILVPLLALYAGACGVSYVRHGISHVDERLMGKWVNSALIALLVALIATWILRFFGAFGGPVPV